jgi:hypothetical protein
MGISLQQPPKQTASQLEWEQYWQKLWTNLFNLNSYVHLDTGNGHHATNTKVRLFSNAVTNDDDFTYTASTGKILVNTRMVALASYTDGHTTIASKIGISLWHSTDTPALTTNIQSITTANRVISTYTIAAGVSNCSTPPMILVPGDILYAQTDGTPDQTSTQVQLKIARIH